VRPIVPDETRSGHPPFVSASFSELMKMIVHNEPSPLRSIGPQLQDLLTGLLAKVPVPALVDRAA
jgi:hypothetical protein